MECCIFLEILFHEGAGFLEGDVLCYGHNKERHNKRSLYLFVVPLYGCCPMSFISRHICVRPLYICLFGVCA